MLRHAFSALKSERASILVVMAITLVVLSMLGGVVLEVGSWYIHRRHLQFQTDAAALAAGQLFSKCFSDPSNAMTDMEAVANQYGGFAGSTVNQAVNGVGSTGGNVSVNYNRLAYPAGSHAPNTDFQDQVDPCTGSLFDVKATETNVQPLFSFSPFATVNAHSRVEIFKENEQTGLLPIGVPDTRFTYAFASFIDEATGNPLSGCTVTTSSGTSASANCELQLYQTGAPNAQGQVLWAPNTGSSISVPIAVKNIGVRIRLVGGTDPTLSCGQQYTECYTDPGATTQGLVYIRGWDPSVGTTAAPAVHNVWLYPSGSCSPNPYFVTSDCSGDVQAEVDFGDRPLTGSGVTATVTASIAGGGSVTLTRGPLVSGTTYDWNGNGLAVTGLGAHAVTLSYSWQQTSGTWRGMTCTAAGNNPCKGSGALENGVPVQRAFEGSLANSGPIQQLEVYEPGVTTGGSNSFRQGTSPSLAVGILVSGTLKVQAAATAPVITLRVVGGSQNQTVDCDPALSTFRAELEQGCSPWYITNPSFNCPFANVPQLWSSPQPWGCTALQTGASVGQLEQGLQYRILGGSNSCTAPIHWPYDQNAYPNDTRVFNLIITPFGSFTGQGNSVVPVIDFGAFYVMGWDQDPCPGAITNVPKGDVAGHFITYLNSRGRRSTEHCYFNDPNQITPCVAVLTR